MNLLFQNILSIIPDSIYLKVAYRYFIGSNLNLKNPKTYNEKLQWLKLNDRNPRYTQLVDKYEVRKYIADNIGEQYLIPLLGVWENFDELNFDKLPNQFVLKCTHDSGSAIICHNKSCFDIESAKKKLVRCLKSNCYYIGREWPYKNVRPRIIAEKLIVDESGTELKDYKLFCFNGEVKALFVATDRQSDTRFDFYDAQFNHLPFTNGHRNATKLIMKPKAFEKMKKLAEQLSSGIPHVRVDLYNINGQIYFGELTFYHWNGFKPFVPEEWDNKFGELIDLSPVNSVK